MKSRPTILVCSRPMGLERGITDRAFKLAWQLDETATDAEKLIEFAGRVCYMSFGNKQSPKTNFEYIRHLISQGHDSVLEHASWSFIIQGVSRALTHQLVRHRIGFSFSQLSQQYVDHSEVQFVPPPGLVESDPLYAEWE